MTTTQSISLKRLVQAKANVRRTGATTGIEALMASIAAHGLRQNLNVRPTTGGRFEVIAGGRRLIALKKLARAGAVPADMPVPCLVLADADNATEISLAENQLREAMHPDDQCEAFRSLTEDGMPVEDVAARFGVSAAVVRQRLKLAAVSPKLRALYRAGETSLGHMMALTLSDDHAAQERAYAEGGSPAGIRHALTRETLRADSRLVQFVGLEAYREAGGAMLADLFNPEDGYLTDPGLLDRLAEARLTEAAEAVAAEGWRWVLPCLQRSYDVTYSRVYGTPQADGGIAFTPEQLAQAGALIGIGYDGVLTVERGLVRPQDARAMARAERGEAAARSVYSAALVTELTGHRTAALRLRLAQTPLVALAAVTHALITACRNPYAPGSVLQLAIRTRDLAGVVAETTDCTAHAGMASVLEGWDKRLPADAAALWNWLLGQDAATLLEVLAAFAASTLDAVHGKAFSGSLAHADRLAEALDLDMTTYWQPSPAMLARVDKRVMVEALTESGHAGLAADLAVMKKPLAAAKAAEALARSGWLPTVLRRPDAAAINDNTLVEAGADAEGEDHDIAA